MGSGKTLTALCISKTNTLANLWFTPSIFRSNSAWKKNKIKTILDCLNILKPWQSLFSIWDYKEKRNDQVFKKCTKSSMVLIWWVSIKSSMLLKEGWHRSIRTHFTHDFGVWMSKTGLWFLFSHFSRKYFLKIKIP